MPNPSPINVPNEQKNVQVVDEKKDSYVKLAMRNMVKKRGTSIFHFMLTIAGVFGVLIGLAIAFH
jgi:hypothetical protein